jgi:alginate O-acetyltransferase complex protein AlgI
LGIGGYPLVSTEAVYYLKSYLPLLVAGCVGATPLVRNLALGLDQRKPAPVLRLAVAGALLLVCTAYLVDGSFNPFLYFRF